MLLLALFSLRAWKADQPIVENYVGRQVPTAMVARNLERGSGFGHPELDTGPFPNWFLVEPPIFAVTVVALKRVTGLALEPSGRLTSALGMVLAGWGLFGLVRRREGPRVALVTVAAFAILPVTIRYGRAFQPDALMLGCLLAGLRSWDDSINQAGRLGLTLGWVLTATGLALKVTSSFVLIPLIGMMLHHCRRRVIFLAMATLAPALLWYVHASNLLVAGQGSRASTDNAAIWLGVVLSPALWQAETYETVGRVLLVRGFTPIGAMLAVWGWLRLGRGDRLWLVWGVSALGALAILAGKLHHDYYFLAVAPLAAVGIARALVDLAGQRSRGRVVAGMTGLGLVALSALQSASTWRTPSEWAGVPVVASAIQVHVPPGAWVVASEAVLFAADRRGCRLESEPGAMIRAAGEWGGTLDPSDPLALVEFYRSQGARFVADVTSRADSPRRRALHEAIRHRYRVLVDRPGVLLAALDSEQAGDPQPWRPNLDRAAR